jgi:response regulator NasT
MSTMSTAAPSDQRARFVLPDTTVPASSEVQAPTVLVVDDDEGVRTAVSEMLQGFGFDVVAQGANGQEAIDLALRLQPQAVLMDLRMPVMDGIEATKRIRAANRHIPVVILSAYDDRSLEAAAAEAGVFCYLLKGMRSGVIRDVLHQAISGDSNRLAHLGGIFFQHVIQTETSRSTAGSSPPSRH